MASGTISTPTLPKRTGTITPATGYTISEDRCVQTGDVVEVHFYISGNFTANTEVTAVTISGVSMPPKSIRTICGYGAHAYDAWNTGYVGLFANGSMNITITATGTRVVLVDLVYTV